MENKMIKFNKAFFVEKKEIFIIILIVLIAIFSRIYEWPYAIKSINADEAMTAVNAKVIAERGTDMFGTQLPIYFGKDGGVQSAILTYLMALSIKIFGYNFFAIRLPSLIISFISIYVFYDLARKIFNNNKKALIFLFFMAINPWHILQSIWSLDCNFLPHFVLLGTYFLVLWLRKNKQWFLYLSIVFYGLTMYTYGISFYFTPIFLFFLFIYLLIRKKIDIKMAIFCFLIYFIIAFPAFLMIILNTFGFNDVKILGFTVQHYAFFNRNTDMLIYSKNIFSDLYKNLITTLKLIITGDDEIIWNINSLTGVFYKFSVIYLVFLLYIFIKSKLKRKRFIEDDIERTSLTVILIWFFTSAFIGLLISEANINKINTIWYPIIFFIAYAVSRLAFEDWNRGNNYRKVLYKLTFIVYTIAFIVYIILQYSFQTNTINVSFCWSSNTIEAIQYADQQDFDRVYIISEIDSTKMGRYLEYSIGYDYDYVIANKKVYRNGKELLPYSSRYRIISILEIGKDVKFDKGIIYVFSKKFFSSKDFSKYNVKEFDNYFVVNFRDK